MNPTDISWHMHTYEKVDKQNPFQGLGAVTQLPLLFFGNPVHHDLDMTGFELRADFGIVFVAQACFRQIRFSGKVQPDRWF